MRFWYKGKACSRLADADFIVSRYKRKGDQISGVSAPYEGGIVLRVTGASCKLI